MNSKEQVVGTKEDQKIQEKAVAALAHYYKHRDYSLINKIALQMPKSNRRVALLKWVQKFSSLRWDETKQSFICQKIPETQDIAAAKSTPFWAFKIKQLQRRHLSGNKFDQDSFFQNFLSDIGKNISEISIGKIEATISTLQVYLKIKNKNLPPALEQNDQ